MMREQNVNRVLNSFPTDQPRRGIILEALADVNGYGVDAMPLRWFLIDGVRSRRYIGCYDSRMQTRRKRGAFLCGIDWRVKSLRFVVPSGTRIRQGRVLPWQDKPELNRVFVDLMEIRQSAVNGLIREVGRQIIDNYLARR